MATITSETELFDNDYVIIRNDGKMYHFEDGEIIIYGDIKMAHHDFIKIKASKILSCTKLSRRYRKELRKNIREFANEKRK